MFWLICHDIYFYVWAPSQAYNQSWRFATHTQNKINKNNEITFTSLKFNPTPLVKECQDFNTIFCLFFFFLLLLCIPFSLLCVDLHTAGEEGLSWEVWEEQVWPLLVVLTTAWGPGDTSPVSALTRPLVGTAST